MVAHTLRIATLTALVIGLTTAASTHARADGDRTQYLTFNRAVALPGVTLHSGTYIFELPSPDNSSDIVRVLSRDRKVVYLTAYTRTVDRPANVPLSEFVSLREAPAGEAMPISVWWSAARTGHEFIYRQ